MKKYRLLSFGWADTRTAYLNQQEEILNNYASEGYVVENIVIGGASGRALIVISKEVVKEYPI